MSSILEQQKKKQAKFESKAGKPSVNRDGDILTFINKFGFCNCKHIQREFKLNRSRSYQIMRRLRQRGLVEHEFIFKKEHGVFLVTTNGATWTKSLELKELNTISLGTYKHQITTIDLYLKLMQLYPKSIWISERQLQYKKRADGSGKYDHVADGVLINGEIHAAIEVELTLKAQDRVEEIIVDNLGQDNIQEVWYFCAENILAPMKKITQEYQQVKIYNLSEFLA